jgi:hypothetical protein
MKGFVTDLKKRAEDNGDFRHVLYTSKTLQLVLMSLKPGQDIVAEIRKKNDQLFRRVDWRPYTLDHWVYSQCPILHSIERRVVITIGRT